MKYFVADPYCEMGIRQLGEQRVSLQPDGSLQYRHPQTGETCCVPCEYWATDWDKSLLGSYNRINEEILSVKAKLESLRKSKQELVAASPRLQRIAKQMKLF